MSTYMKRESPGLELYMSVDIWLEWDPRDPALSDRYLCDEGGGGGGGSVLTWRGSLLDSSCTCLLTSDWSGTPETQHCPTDICVTRGGGVTYMKRESPGLELYMSVDIWLEWEPRDPALSDRYLWEEGLSTLSAPYWWGLLKCQCFIITICHNSK